jgi:hypothetical protein
VTIPADRSPDRITPGKAVEPEKTISQPPSTFESYMEGTSSGTRGTPPSITGAGPATAAAPMQPGTPTFQTLQAQAKNAQDSLGTVGEQLNTPNLKLKRSQTHLLKNKLQDSNSSLQSAGTKLGVDIPEMQTSDTPSPVGRFLAYVGHGQDILMSVQQKLKALAASNTQINPADMMLVQIKMSQAQQEIEYSSTLLGKVIDSLKQIMNIQL